MSDAIRVALATSTPGLDLDRDLPAMLAALRARGLDAVAVCWDAEGFDWSACAAVVIRSTWDYAERRTHYLAWAEAVAAVTRLDNPIALLRWNTDKRYLHELAARGVPVVPTRFVAPGEPPILPEHGEFVVKPAVSAGARDTARYAQRHRDAARRHVAALHAGGATAMVQPYLSRIDEGERALVFLGGAFSHAMRKGPVLTEPGVLDNDREAHPGLLPHQPSAAELDLAAAALAAVPGSHTPLYARVDLALADDGSPVLMELELVEPNLFIIDDDTALRRFTDLVHERAR
ncbi:RimK family alpha-L-glutamate ligase [Embleya sp. NPDC020886]|uniref:RimK family alpha-L-glutamate ligase n=1 Tax=Embleya sp. NPDC020886 TaxID=3363980 RepID=UPI0037931584